MNHQPHAKTLNTLFVQEILLAQSLSAFQTHVHWSPSQFLTQSFSHSCPFTWSSEFHCGSCHWPFLDYFTCVCVCSVISVVSDSVILWTVAHQSPQSMEFSRQEYWGGLSCLSPGDHPDLEIEPVFLALLADPLQTEPPRKPWITLYLLQNPTLWLCLSLWKSFLIANYICLLLWALKCLISHTLNVDFTLASLIGKWCLFTPMHQTFLLLLLLLLLLSHFIRVWLCATP